MTKKSVETSEIEALESAAISKTEQFLETNGKKVVIAICSLLVVAAAVFGYKVLVVEPTEARASEAIYAAQAALESNAPDYKAALEGDQDRAGFLEVIAEYGSTPSGNLANHYAGICYLRLGDNANAQRYLSAYKAQKGIPAQIINAQNLGLQGDIAVNNGDYTLAIELFNKAAKASDNILTTPLYMRKAAQVAIAAGDNAQAKMLLEQIKSKYPASAEARGADKYLGTIK